MMFFIRSYYIHTASGFMIVHLPYHDHGLTDRHKSFDGLYTGITLIDRQSACQTTLTHLFQINLGSRMQARSPIRSRASSHLIVVHRTVVTSIKLFFEQRLVLSRDLPPSSAKIIALALLAKRVGAHTSVDHVRSCIMKYKALVQLILLYPPLELVLVAVLRNKLNVLGNSTAPKTVLRHLSDAKATVVGGNLSLVLCSGTSPAAAVDEWILQHPALEQSQREYPWFWITMDMIAQSLVGDARWGSEFRIAVSTVLSYFEIISDIVVIRNLFRDGETSYAQFILLCLVLNVVMQCILVFSTYSRNKRVVC